MIIVSKISVEKVRTETLKTLDDIKTSEIYLKLDDMDQFWISESIEDGHVMSLGHFILNTDDSKKKKYVFVIHTNAIDNSFVIVGDYEEQHEFHDPEKLLLKSEYLKILFKLIDDNLKWVMSFILHD